MNAAANVQSVTVKSPVIRNSCRTEENKTHRTTITHKHTLPSKKKEPVSVCPRAASCVVRCSNGNPRPPVWVAAAAEEQRQQREDSVVAFYKRVGEGSLKNNISSGSAFASSPSAKRKPLKSIILSFNGRLLFRSVSRKAEVVPFTFPAGVDHSDGESRSRSYYLVD